MRVEDAWAAGFTGKDITVTVLDDGVEKEQGLNVFVDKLIRTRKS